jgi:hypothetical protein
MGRRSTHAESGGLARVNPCAWGVALAGGAGFRGEGTCAVVGAVGFGFGGGGGDERWVDGPAAVFGGFGWDAEGGEGWAENGD